MSDKEKTKAQLIEELQKLRQRVAELEASEAERKRAEEALRESEENFRALADNANDGIMIAAGKGAHVYANRRMAEITGYSVPELLKTTMADLVHPDQLKEVMERFQRRLEGKPAPRQYEIVFVRKDGKSVPLEMTSAKTVWRGQPATIVVFRDITKRKRAEAEREWLLTALEHRSTQFQVAAEVSRATSSILEPDELIQQVVNLVRERFDLYYAGLFLMDQTGEWTGEPGKWAVLRAGTGQAGQKMLEQGHKLEVGGESMIGWCMANKQARIALDVGQEAVRFDNPLLPETRSEMALPLVARGQVIGAMTIQSAQAAAFSEEDIAVLQTMADQLANAIENAHLFERMQHTSFLLGERVRELHCLNDIGRKIEETPPIPEFLPWVAARIRAAMQYPDLCLAAIQFEGQVYGATEAVSLPCQMVQALRIGGEVVGRVYISYIEKRDFTDEESAMLGDIVRRVSDYIESRHLFEETQAHAEEMAVLNELSQALTARLSVKEVLDEVHRGASRLLDATNFYVALYDPDRDEATFPLDVTEIEDDKFHTLPADQGLTGHIIRNRTSVLIEENVPGRLAEMGVELVGETALSWLGVPMMVGDQVLGVMGVQSFTTPRAYDEHDRDLLTALAGQTAIALQNARLFEETQRRAKELAALNELGRALTARLSVEEVLEETYRQASRLVDTTNFYIGLYDPERHEITFSFEVSESEIDRQITVMSADEGLTGYIVRNRTSLLFEENVAEQEKELGIEGPGEEAQSWLGVPLMIGDQVLGVMAVQSHATPRLYDEHDQALLTAIASQAAVALESAHLFEQIQTRAERERAIREISDQMQRATDMETLMRITAEELSRALGGSRAYVRLGTET